MPLGTEYGMPELRYSLALKDAINNYLVDNTMPNLGTLYGIFEQRLAIAIAENVDFGGGEVPTYTPFNKEGDTLTGLGGLGFYGAIAQSASPSSPSSGFRLFSDSQNRFVWKGTNGFLSVLSTINNTGDRTYTLPNVNGTIALTSDISGYVPYTGATTNLDLGINNIVANKLGLNTSPTLGTLSVGQIYWDTTNKTASINLNSNVNLQIGQELQIYVRNNTGSVITNGSVVYQTGVIGGHPTIALALANAENTTYPLAVATQDIQPNDWGYCTTFGKVRDLNTNSYNENDELYLSATTAGQFTATPPSSPNFVVKIGSITVKNSSNGEVLVNIQDPISNSNTLGTSQKIGATQNAIKTYIDSGLSSKQNTLISETNIKSLTINGNASSLLGSGTISINTGGGGSVVTGNTAPITISPTADGEIYINTSSKKFYIGLTTDGNWYEITTTKFSGGTVLLMHFDGANNSTTFVDEKGKTVTNNGSPIISTAQFKFGTASGYFNGSSSVSIAANQDFIFGTEDFTMECFIYKTQAQSLAAGIMGNLESNNDLTMNLRFEGTDKIFFGTWNSALITSPNSLSLNTWHHIAISRQGNVFKYFENGVTVGSLTSALNFSASTPFNIGSSTPPSNNFVGYIDELRITKGLARYTNDFTPPSTPFTN